MEETAAISNKQKQINKRQKIQQTNKHNIQTEQMLHKNSDETAAVTPLSLGTITIPGIQHKYINIIYHIHCL